jgi:hypothetical protein
MLSAHLVRMVEQHADKLTDELVDDIQRNERTKSFRQVSRDQLRQQILRFYHHLGEWLSERSETIVEKSFEDLGRDWFHRQVPLEELLWALNLTKQHLRERIRGAGALYSSVELHNEIQIGMAVGRFFDHVLYAVVKAYEEERRAGKGPKGEVPKFDVGSEPSRINWVP